MRYMVPSGVTGLRKIGRSKPLQNLGARTATTLRIRVVAEYGLLEDLFGRVECSPGRLILHLSKSLCHSATWRLEEPCCLANSAPEALRNCIAGLANLAHEIEIAVM